MKKRKNYSGADLSPQFKSWVRKEFKRITAELTKLGCTDVQFNYGFYYFSGFFTAPSGQVYYMSCSDVRHFTYDKLLYRTAKDYSDFTGGHNNYVGKDNISTLTFR